MIIAVDIDGTLLNVLDPWLCKYNELSGDKLTTNDIIEYYWGSLIRPEYRDTYHSIRSPEMYMNDIKPVHGAVTGVQALVDQGHRLVCVSHDRAEFALCKADAVSRYFPIQDIVFAKRKGVVKYDILIDDAPHNEPDILLAQKYNESSSGKWLCRAPWDLIPAYVYLLSTYSSTYRRHNI